MTDYFESLATIAAKVGANKPILEKILSDLRTDDEQFVLKNFALNSIIGAIEEHEKHITIPANS